MRNNEKTEISKNIIGIILFIYFVISLLSISEGYSIITCLVRHALNILLLYIYYKNEFGPGLVVSLILIVMFTAIFKIDGYENRRTLWIVIDIIALGLLTYAYVKFIKGLRNN